MGRSYGQYCGIARALDVVGDRWALLVVRELLYLGPRRFRDLQAALPGLAPNLLTRRLRELERAGVLARATLPEPARVPVYGLTRRGRELEPVLRALLLLDAQVFQAVVAEGRMEILVGSQHPPDAVATSDTATLADVAAGRVAALDVLSAGALRLEGDPDALATFDRLFGHNPALRPPV